MSEWSELVSGVVGGGLVLAIQHGKQVWDDRRDSKNIYLWLVDESKKPSARTRRSTRAIARAVNLTPDRVAMLCHEHNFIFPNVHGRDDLWSLNR